MPRHDVAIYSPSSAGIFRRGHGRAAGAERQMALLGRELAARGLHVSLVVFPVGERDDVSVGGMTIVERSERRPRLRFLVPFVEGVRVIRSLRAADGAVVIATGGTPVIGVIALYCRLTRRSFVFAAASDLDFEPTPPGQGRRRFLYRLGVRLADAVVVLSGRQIDFARESFPRLSPDVLVHIPYFVASDPDSSAGRPREEFLWIARLHEVKRPQLYIELAEALPEARFATVALMDLYPSAAQVEMMEHLQNAARRLPNFVVGGALPHEAVVERLRRAVALVNTSSNEGMPNTFLEAWSVGVPVLSLAIDPDGMVGERGLGVAASGSWDAFVAGADELWRMRDHSDELAARTRGYVDESHSLEAVGSRWLELLSTLGARSRPAGA